MNFLDPFGVTDQLKSLFGGGQEEGYEELQKMLQQGMGEMKGYVEQGNTLLNPYNQNGMNQYGTLQNSINRMMNPQQFMADIMKGYSMSPQAQHQMAVGNDATMNAAAASGMMGSTPLLNNVNEQSQQIANRDQQQYLNNALGIYNQGLGTSQGLYSGGLGAAGQMSNNLAGLSKAVADMFGQMGQAKLGQAQAGNQGLMGMLGGLGGLFSSLPAGGLLGALAI